MTPVEVVKKIAIMWPTAFTKANLPEWRDEYKRMLRGFTKEEIDTGWAWMMEARKNDFWPRPDELASNCRKAKYGLF